MCDVCKGNNSYGKREDWRIRNDGGEASLLMARPLVSNWFITASSAVQQNSVSLSIHSDQTRITSCGDAVSTASHYYSIRRHDSTDTYTYTYVTLNISSATYQEGNP